jgi:hypothetical protein
MRAREPGQLRCAYTITLTPKPAPYRLVHMPTGTLTPFSMMCQDASALSPNSRRSTKTQFEIHTGCCRVRRKRKRLTSNHSIESDAAIRHPPRQKSISPRHFR